MKKTFISAGLVVLGAAGLQPARADGGLDVISPKAWNVSATLRGFYDDNYSVSNAKRGSFGVELSPQISFNIPLQQTDLGFRYTYGLYYYEQRDELNLQPFDQTHQFDLWFDHSFNERWKLKITDSLALGQEPELIGPASPTTPNPVPFRVAGDNLANHADATLDTEWTRLFSTSLHYGNNYYAYDNSGSSVDPLVVPGTLTTLPAISSHVGTPGWQTLSSSGASLAGLLNRIEQSLSLDLKWAVQPETTVFLGYNFSLVNYTGNESIAVANYVGSVTPQFGLVGNPPQVGITGYTPNSPQSVVYRSDSRDSISHYVYLGVTHQFTANLGGTARGGASFTDNYNDPLYPSTSIAPYADLNLTYTYIPGSYVQLGFTHDINSTDIATVDSSGHLTQYQESSVIYADINHRITSKLIATLVGRYQYSVYEGGASSAGGDTSYSFGANLNYQINRHFSAEAGYNFDDLVSGLDGRAYDRNRVYIGMTANY